MLKKLFNKAKEFVAQVKSVATAVMVAAMTMPAYATGVTPVKPVDNINVVNVLGTIAGALLMILQGIGLIFIVWGGFQFAMSLRDEDAAAKSRAILVLIAGVCMVGLKALLTLFGLIQ